jgi:hypothetical protein
VPYKKTDQTPNLGGVDEADDIRGGMGFEGLQELAKFVQEGGALIVEGSTSTLMAEYVLNSGVTVEHPANLFARGSILRSTIADLKSPIAYGYEAKDLPVYFNQDPVLNAAPAAGAPGFAGGRAGPDVGQNVTPNAVPLHVSPLEGGGAAASPARPAGGGRGASAGPVSEERPRVVVRFTGNANYMLLSGTLAGGEALVNRAAVVDVPLGKGHIVMFALRPFWRWQTQGTFFLGFNAILNWDHLDAGKPEAAGSQATAAN